MINDQKPRRTIPTTVPTRAGVKRCRHVINVADLVARVAQQQDARHAPRQVATESAPLPPNVQILRRDPTPESGRSGRIPSKDRQRLAIDTLPPSGSMRPE
jgi:hypothetical protein